MILVRPYTPRDFEKVKELHQKQGLKYELPDINDDSMVVRAVIENDGKITDAAFLRKTSEAYWVFNPEESTRRDRLGSLLILQKELIMPAKRVGISDVHCWLPPEVQHDKRTVRTMMKMGWTKPLWTCYSREVE